ncbi:hypothetical protein ACH4U6_22750 [Streptomyces netropsis]
MPDGKKQKTKVPSVDDDAIQGVDTARAESRTDGAWGEGRPRKPG